MSSLQIFKKSAYRDTSTLKHRCASENVFSPFDKIIWSSHINAGKINGWLCNIVNERATWKFQNSNTLRMERNSLK